MAQNYYVDNVLNLWRTSLGIIKPLILIIFVRERVRERKKEIKHGFIIVNSIRSQMLDLTMKTRQIWEHFFFISRHNLLFNSRNCLLYFDYDSLIRVFCIRCKVADPRPTYVCKFKRNATLSFWNIIKHLIEVYIPNSIPLKSKIWIKF